MELVIPLAIILIPRLPPIIVLLIIVLLSHWLLPAAVGVADDEVLITMPAKFDDVIVTGDAVTFIIHLDIVL